MYRDGSRGILRIQAGKGGGVKSGNATAPLPPNWFLNFRIFGI